MNSTAENIIRIGLFCLMSWLSFVLSLFSISLSLLMVRSSRSSRSIFSDTNSLSMYLTIASHFPPAFQVPYSEFQRGNLSKLIFVVELNKLNSGHWPIHGVTPQVRCHPWYNLLWFRDRREKGNGRKKMWQLITFV